MMTKDPFAVLFCGMYTDPARALIPLQRIGVGREHLNLAQAPALFWREAIVLVDALGLMPKLVDYALADKSVAGFHEKLRAAWTARETPPPARADDDGPELAAIAEQVRPVVDAGKGRALAFEVVRALLMIFSGGPERTAGTVWLAEQLAALARWHERARDVESGEEQKREVGQRLSLLDVAGIADRIASAAWCQARTGQPFPFERAIVLDIATALRRACGCTDWPRGKVTEIEQQDGGMFAVPIAAQIRRDREHTANVLLPLLIRDARRLCAAAKVDVGPIEAAIARHGGRPS